MRACFLASVVAAQTIVVSPAGPLKTLVEARDAARAQRRPGNTGPFTIRVSDGAHYLSDTLVLTPEDSVVRAVRVRRHEEPRGSDPPHGSRDGAQNFDFVGYFNSTRSTNAWSSCNRHGSLIDTGPCRSYSHFYLSLGLKLEG